VQSETAENGRNERQQGVARAEKLDLLSEGFRGRGNRSSTGTVLVLYRYNILLTDIGVS